jgi:hypothetical protein
LTWRQLSPAWPGRMGGNRWHRCRNGGGTSCLSPRPLRRIDHQFRRGGRQPVKDDGGQPAQVGGTRCAATSGAPICSGSTQGRHSCGRRPNARRAFNQRRGGNP